ncbi:hypothetical protein GQ44DRAFT_802724 [Phaeosphaeriaceae sp. PMI808]|nr:hypothetical protein GQ44DRAFT_802724 [Phaeosphaeriaceae sp. PMI808]
MQRPEKTTYATITRFIAAILPHKENNTPRLFHVPRNPRYDAETATVEQIILSVAPTSGVYALIGHTPGDENVIGTVNSSTLYSLPPRTLCFLYQPFDLDQRSVRRGTLTLSSHNAFNELLTVGWNLALAERIQMNEEFGEPELAQIGLSEMGLQRGWATADTDAPGKHVLYPTGQPRVGGLAAAKAMGLTVVCVGHRPAEDCGIRYLAGRLRTAFPRVRVEEICEGEQPRSISVKES